MQITIKVLKGKDCTLEVSPTSTVLEVKKQIDALLQIPAPSQKLLLLGRPLNDDQQISSYPNIKDGTKLNLVVMKPDTLRDAIHRSFRKYYSEQQSERLTNEFMVDFEQKFGNGGSLSLDDLERFADSALSKVAP
ncbi:NEDD8 [Scaptodrosophila lebanonensis]|uniref:NEDD8 n=1 Tax=Drosophila lebanonensis TaxID=7225 RepID=A0A6J2TAE2_DROLE|nr:NEDD8 [Scaptodrosophila lebanonensis]